MRVISVETSMSTYARHEHVQITRSPVREEYLSPPRDDSSGLHWTYTYFPAMTFCCPLSDDRI